MRYAKYLTEIDRVKHRPYYKYGENIFFGHPYVKTPLMVAVDSMYKEIMLYDFDNPKPVEKVGHFTQIVWKKSKYFGTGYAKTSNGSIFVVMNYEPFGNDMYSLKTQVPRLVDSIFENTVVNRHNIHRFKHGADPLEQSRNVSYV